MDFGWTSEDAELYDRILSFARRLGEDVVARDRAHRFGHDEWRACGELGLLGLCLPHRYGGLGLSALSTAHGIEAFGRGCVDMGLVFSAAAHLFACAMPIALHASESLCERVLPELARGTRIGANAITEAEAGSDVYALRTSARREGGDYVLSGVKSYVTNGSIADVFVVYAKTEPAHGFLGISAFVVERDNPGLAIGAPMVKVGLTTSPTCSIYLDECRVPADHRIGDEGAGARVFESSMQWERACLFAGYLGAMQRQLDEVLEFARARRQFGRPIGRHQAIAHRVADMKLRLDAARLLLLRGCWALDRGGDATLEVSLAKLAVSEAAIQSGLDAVQIFGGLGVVAESGIERGLRDAIPSTIFSGTSEIQRDLIAKRLGL
jgi:alkylation response protein AidB-like acyl-CoA dehydrogenase